MTGGNRLVVSALALALSVRPVTVWAEEWYDAYRAGLEALKLGQGPKAIDAFRRAIRLRREPGLNVITYGTNKVDCYCPYLRLAEAYLLVHDPEGARGALKESEAMGREPAVERASVGVLVETAVPPPPATLPVVPPLPTGVTPADPDLAAGIRQVERGQFADAIALLDPLTRRLAARAAAAGPSPQLAQAYLYLGIAYIGRAQQEGLQAATRPAPSR
jgi:hypothetical protein